MVGHADEQSSFLEHIIFYYFRPSFQYNQLNVLIMAKNDSGNFG